MNLGDSKDHRSRWDMWNFQVLLKAQFENIELIQWLCKLSGNGNLRVVRAFT